MANNPEEGIPRQVDDSMIVNRSDMLRVLGDIPGGLKNLEAVRLAYLAHGLDGTADDTAVNSTGGPGYTETTRPYSSDQGYPAAAAGTGVHQVEGTGHGAAGADGHPTTRFRNVRHRGQPDPAGQQNDQGWPGQGWSSTAGYPQAATGPNAVPGQVPAGLLGAPVSAGIKDNPWLRPAGSSPSGHNDVAATRADLPADLGRTQTGGDGKRAEKAGGIGWKSKAVAILSVAALAGTVFAAAEFIDHKRHVDFNRKAQATVSVPAYIQEGTEARTTLESAIPAIQGALVDRAISADETNSLHSNMLYNLKLGQVPLIFLLQIGGGDPKTAGYPGIVMPLPPKTYAADYKLLTEHEHALGEPITPNNANDPAVDARVVELDMNRYWAEHFKPGDRPSVTDLVRAYAGYEAMLLGAKTSKDAADFVGSSANLAAQWFFTLKQYQALATGKQQYYTLAHDDSWLKHEGALANKGSGTGS